MIRKGFVVSLSFMKKVLGTSAFAVALLLFTTYRMTRRCRGKIGYPKLLLSLKEVQTFAKRVDAILVLSGGHPSSRSPPSLCVKASCQIAAEAHKMLESPPILTLETRQCNLDHLRSSNSLTGIESESAATYLMSNHKIESEKIYMFTAPNVIWSAYYARTVFCQVMDWKRLIIVSCKYDMPYVRVIYDWVFNAPSREGDHATDFELFYLENENVGPSCEAVNMDEYLEKMERLTMYNCYRTLPKILKLLTTKSVL